MTEKLQPTNMQISDLREGMDQLGVSAEELSRRVPVSNMTIRRLLKRNPTELVPEKYAVHFNQAFISSENGETFSQERIINSKSMEDYLIELSNQVESNEIMEKQLDEKLSGFNFERDFLGKVKDLRKWAFQKENIAASLIALGALAYFLNPFDMIPDYLGIVGYVDDLGVLSLAQWKIAQLVKFV